MAGNIPVYNLGRKGVNLVKSPLEMDDSELQQAQNAEFYQERGVAGIRKRPALRRLNTSQLSTSVQGAVGLEFTTNGGGTDANGAVYVALATTPSWKVSTNGGSSWAATTLLVQSIEGPTRAQQVTFNGRAYYPSINDSVGLYLCFDGEQEFSFTQLTGGPSGPLGLHLYAIGMHDGYLYTAIGDGTTGRLYAVDPVTGSAIHVAKSSTFNDATTRVTSICSFNGRLWFTLSSDDDTFAAASSVCSLKPFFEDSWTVERSTTDTTVAGANYRQYTDLIVYSGNLYAGLWAGDGVAATIEKRTPAGTWTTNRTSAETTDNNRYGPFVVYSGHLYAQYEELNDSEAATVLTFDKYDGSSWTSDHDAFANGAEGRGYFIVKNTALYASGLKRVFKKSGGTWSTVLSDATLAHGLLL